MYNSLVARRTVRVYNCNSVRVCSSNRDACLALCERRLFLARRANTGAPACAVEIHTFRVDSCCGPCARLLCCSRRRPSVTRRYAVSTHCRPTSTPPMRRSTRFGVRVTRSLALTPDGSLTPPVCTQMAFRPSLFAFCVRLLLGRCRLRGRAASKQKPAALLCGRRCCSACAPCLTR